MAVCSMRRDRLAGRRPARDRAPGVHDLLCDRRAAGLRHRLPGPDSADHRSRAARHGLKGCLVGGLILLFFALFGDRVLAAFGITLPALRTAGGVLLLLFALELMFARSS